MNLKKFETFLNEYLDIQNFNDYCPNGLQVEVNNDVKKIALGVSASLKLFKKAKEINADTVITHHGLFWKGQSGALKGVMGKRVSYLFKNDINLFGYHLPLDYHPKIGNNASIADKLNLEKRETFAKHGGVDIGIIGQLNTPVNISLIQKNLLKIFGQINTIYNFGLKEIKKIAIVSGGATTDFYEAIDKGADLYITGEVNEPIQEWCREASMNYIAIGHYYSETLGILNLGKIVSKKFKIPCHFISIPNKN